MKSAHADELLDLQTPLSQSLALSNSLQAQVQTATEMMKDLESGIEASAGRYNAAQVEVNSLEQDLAAARTYVDEHEVPIQALQHERTVLQIEHTQLGAERDRIHLDLPSCPSFPSRTFNLSSMKRRNVLVADLDASNAQFADANKEIGRNFLTLTTTSKNPKTIFLHTHSTHTFRKPRSSTAATASMLPQKEAKQKTHAAEHRAPPHPPRHNPECEPAATRRTAGPDQTFWQNLEQVFIAETRPGIP
ncbi:hypothetical protein JB92DRAFT_3116016 [Gautieria morchelliformis]|nr:hypothetical protein JB92DRAFT_3116016 [Gautieria morchelliformis]